MNAIVIANESVQAELEAGPDVLAWNHLSEIRVPTMVGCGSLDLTGISWKRERAKVGRPLAKARAAVMGPG